MTRNFTALEHLELRPATGWKPYLLNLTKLLAHKLRHLRTLRNNGHVLDPCSPELSVNPFLTSMTFTYSLQQTITNGRSVGCESLLAAIRHAPNLESFSAVIPLAGPSPTFLGNADGGPQGMQPFSQMSHAHQRAGSHPPHRSISPSRLCRGLQHFPKLEELSIDYGLFIRRHGHAVGTNAGQLAKSVKWVYIQGCVSHLGPHGDFKK